jgi:hypothetical protein
MAVRRFSSGLKLLEREDDYSSSSTDEIKNVYLHFLGCLYDMVFKLSTKSILTCYKNISTGMGVRKYWFEISHVGGIVSGTW